MARKPSSKKTPSSKKLAGKTIAFVGKFGYRDLWLSKYEGYAATEGATIFDAESIVPDLLVVGEGRGGNPPAQAGRLQKKHPQMQVVDETGFCRLIMPTRDELIAELRAGQGDDDYQRWDSLDEIFRLAGGGPDLSGADLRKANLYGAKLVHVKLDGADLRGVSAHYGHFPVIANAKFDGADLTNAYFTAVQSCSFRDANLTKGWFVYGSYHQGPVVKYEDCDFRGAKMPGLRGDNGAFLDCTFSSADLSDAELERCDFTGSTLAGANLSRAHLHKSKLNEVNLSRCVLFRADLREASLRNADLRKADLREAVLSGADLKGANIAGADFAGAVLTGANITGLDTSVARNCAPPVTRKPGPNMIELARVAAGATKQFSTSAEVDLGKGEHATLSVSYYIRNNRGYPDAVSRYKRDNTEAFDRISAPTFEQAMLRLADRWPNATLRLDTIKAGGSRLLQGKKLTNLAMAAWSEAFGVEAGSPETLQQQKQEQEAALQQMREAMLREIRGGKAGVKKWNARPDRERDQMGPPARVRLQEREAGRHRSGQP
jgi:uncharacterized protein YjbI with pentapeptide repeats